MEQPIAKENWFSCDKVTCMQPLNSLVRWENLQTIVNTKKRLVKSLLGVIPKCWTVYKKYACIRVATEHVSLSFWFLHAVHDTIWVFNKRSVATKHSRGFCTRSSHRFTSALRWPMKQKLFSVVWDWHLLWKDKGVHMLRYGSVYHHHYSLHGKAIWRVECENAVFFSRTGGCDRVRCVRNC